ncbi:MAG: 1-(5-phosphoribosyl)-5-[(5-phosphoribosylamino)methylideneamino]imidazole-4-carboxamide isomerase [Bacteroides sp.]|nr:1-(5-phosphoribosyl)-5-[(5-phosphoribosylamino)methylideneamino]imidazole-4-carboxamide isomerase [Bacteroides sp.]
MIELIPAIDIIDGKCVRLSRGDYDSRKVYNENPVEVAKQLEAHGVRRLHVVDLDGAASHHIVNYRILEQIASRTSLIIDFGGGVKSDEDLVIAFENGAQMVTGGSIAVKNPQLFCHWLQMYGSEKIILGADVKDRKIAVNGWKDESTCELFPFLEDYVQKGIRKVICTDIQCDGMLQGPSIALYKEILERNPGLYLIASGGVSNADDIRALEAAGVPAVIFGKALYEGRITMKELEDMLVANDND